MSEDYETWWLAETTLGDRTAYARRVSGPPKDVPPLTFKADLALRFRTRAACEAFCRRKRGRPLRAAEHAFYTGKEKG